MCNYIDPDQIANVVNDDCLSDLTVFHGNVRSLRKNLDKLCDIFQNGTKLPDIIGVTETKLKEHLNEIDIDGYDFEHCSSSTEAGGAGIYVANYLEYFVRKDLSLNDETSEDMWVEITTKNTSRGAKYSDLKNLIIGIVYRHPGSQYSGFCGKLCNVIDRINRSNKKFVIMGDINVNLEKYNIVGSITDYIQNIEGAGCLSFIDKATRVEMRGDRWETSCIDHVYSNIEPTRMQNYVITSRNPSFAPVIYLGLGL